MVIGLAAPPADLMTVCPLSLATWHTTDPTAPDAAETNATSPSLSIAILSKATQAVSPGPPVVDNRALVRWIVGHRNHSDRIYADEMLLASRKSFVCATKSSGYWKSEP
jgi:hypothetical protein